jgi:hypothetical protein
MSTRSLSLLAIMSVGCASAGPGVVPDNQPDADTSRHEDAGDVDSPPRPDAASSGSCADAFTGVLATWAFTGDAGSQTTTASTSTATGVIAGAIGRASGLSVNTGADSMNASNWPTAAQRDASKYFTFSITPPSGCALDLTSASIDAKASATGPTKASIGTDADSFAQEPSVSTSAAGNATLSVADAKSAVEVRIYGWSASSAGGTMRLEGTLTLTGALH